MLWEEIFPYALDLNLCYNFKSFFQTKNLFIFNICKYLQIMLTCDTSHIFLGISCYNLSFQAFNSQIINNPWYTLEPNYSTSSCTPKHSIRANKSIKFGQCKFYFYNDVCIVWQYMKPNCFYIEKNLHLSMHLPHTFVVAL